ncbi:MAG: hypothetical protein J6T89_00015 [Bacteroidales bacterium]|nr:hypothetical protein [Bacteroidales bacterium]
MKARQVLVFLCSVFAILGAVWLLFPSEGIAAGPLQLRFSSYQRALSEAKEHKVNVDSVLTAVESRFAIKRDTLSFYKEFFTSNPDRIYLPGDDYTFFDPVFEAFETQADTAIVRVAHYGDSQIEMDRISGELREGLQKRFGGGGTGMFPVKGNVPSASISRSATENFTQYTMYGDSTTLRAPHNRYGVMAQVVQLSGGGTVTLRAAKGKSVKEGVKQFSSISVLYGRASKGFSVKVVSDSLRPVPVQAVTESGAGMLTWHFSHPVQKASLYFRGSAEIYGISADASVGVAVDNIPLRGCSGTIFTRISPSLLKESFALDNTRLIILQFGGNYMPVARNSQVIASYSEQIQKQIAFFHEAAPQAKILFIGPSDMGKSVRGRVVTWPRLPEMVDSLKAVTLRNDAAYWDLYRMMGGENSMVQWVRHSPALAGPDYIHFTPAGAQKVGETLTRSLLIYHDFYSLRKEISPEKVKKAFSKE